MKSFVPLPQVKKQIHENNTTTNSNQERSRARCMAPPVLKSEVK